MNSSEDKNVTEYLEQLRMKLQASGPIVPFPAIGPFLKRHSRNAKRGRKREGTVVWVTVGATAIVALAVAVGFFYGWKLPGATETQVSGPAHVIPAPQLQAPGPPTTTDSNRYRTYTRGQRNATPQIATPRAASGEEPALPSMPGDVFAQRSLPVIMQASWSPTNREPLRVFVLDSAELTRIGIFLMPDGAITTVWNATEVSFGIAPEADTAEAVAPVMNQQRQGNRTEFTFSTTRRSPVHTASDSITHAAIEATRRKRLMISTALQTDEHGRRILNRTSLTGTEIQVPDIAATPLVSGSSHHVAFHVGPSDRRLDDLIPVLIRTRNMMRIFWFEPGRDLFLHLPKPVLLELEERAEQREKRREPGLNGQDVRFAFRSGEEDRPPEIDIELKAQRDLGLALYDIEGNRVKELTPLRRYAKGTWKQEVSVADVPSGVYLIAVLSPHGEESVRRISVQ